MKLPHSPSPAPIICPCLSYLHGSLPTPQLQTCPALDVLTTQGVPPPKAPSSPLPSPTKLPETPQAPPWLTTAEKSPRGPKYAPTSQVVPPPLGPHNTTLVTPRALGVIYGLGLSLPAQRAAPPGRGWVLLLSPHPCTAHSPVQSRHSLLLDAREPPSPTYRPLIISI